MKVSGYSRVGNASQIDTPPQESEDPRIIGLKHWLEFEIQRTAEWMEDKENPVYDGVYVGSKEAKLLQERHIKFCERLLKMI